MKHFVSTDIIFKIYKIYRLPAINYADISYDFVKVSPT